MKGVEFIAKTEKGEKAMKKSLQENKNAPWTQRKMYEAMYKQIVFTEKPFRFRIEHRLEKNSLLIPPSSMVPPIELAFNELGLKKGIDYEVKLDE